MRTVRCSRPAGAFSLIELLVVIAIIAILAALLLPVLSQGRAHAKRIQCINQLQEAGVAFQSFAHDHNGQFPMAVPLSAGGSLEFSENGYRVGGPFFFGFRHFQAISNELVVPKTLVCPTDTRAAAASFAALQNENVSYFVAVQAAYNQPNSILAGDRNLTNDWTGPAALVHLGPNFSLRWTEELHRFKGNLLFADGHVEQRNNVSLTLANNQPATTVDLFLPLTRASAAAGAGGAGGQPKLGTPSSGAENDKSAKSDGKNKKDAASPVPPGRMAAGTFSRTLATATVTAAPRPEPPATVQPESPHTNAPSVPSGPAAPEKPESEDGGGFAVYRLIAAFAHNVAKAAPWWLFLLLLLILAALVTMGIRRWMERRKGPGARLQP